MIGSILLVAPSADQGGGVERYVSTIEAALSQQEVPYRRLNLFDAHRPHGLAAKLRLIREVRRAIRTSPVPLFLVLAHRNLLPVVWPVAGRQKFAGASVILHGDELWSRRPHRGLRTMRRRDVRVIAVSNFSAGALATRCHASVLHPGLAREWYDTLVEASIRAQRASEHLELVTAFRLNAWRDKGLDTLLEAISLLNDERIRLTICGSGPVLPEVAAMVASHDWCRIESNLSDRALAEHLARADLFVLATRTRRGAAACGEGFGLVLLEAQIAGTPVVAPAYGGSGDVFLQDLTGMAPMDESPEALAAVLAMLLSDDRRRAEMGEAAAVWTRARFEPNTYARHAVATLLGQSHGAPIRAASGQARTTFVGVSADGY